MSRKRYSDLIILDDYFDRFNYARLYGKVGQETFGFDRYVNQAFYTSREWKAFRDSVIVRDNGCDLAHPDYPIHGRIYIHHLNPLTLEEIEKGGSELFDLNNVICVSQQTHNAIHYGDESLLPRGPVVRLPNDTCPWR